MPITCQVSKSPKMALWRRLIKKELDIMRFRLYKFNFDLTCKGHQSYLKIFFMNILRCFDDHIWASLCQVPFWWTSSIVLLFGFMTSDKQLAIHLNISSTYSMSSVKVFSEYIQRITSPQWVTWWKIHY